MLRSSLGEKSTAWDFCQEVHAWGFLLERNLLIRISHGETHFLGFLAARNPMLRISCGEKFHAWDFSGQEIHCLGFLVARNSLLGISLGSFPNTSSLNARQNTTSDQSLAQLNLGCQPASPSRKQAIQPASQPSSKTQLS